MYKQIFTEPKYEKIYRDWIKVNKNGTLHQFKKYLSVLEECLEVRQVGQHSVSK